MRHTMISLALGAALVAAGAASPAPRARTPNYVVISSTLSPSAKRVPRGASVTWFNVTARPRTVTSDTHAWKPFRLAPAGRHAVKFPKVGRYRYHVGKLRGTIVVTGGGGTDGSSKRLFHYDFTVTGHAQSSATTSGLRSDFDGTETLTMDWKTTFRAVPVQKLVVGNFLTLLSKGTNGLAHGVTDATYTYADTSQVGGGPCHGTVTFNDLGTHFAVVGKRDDSETFFKFVSQLDSDAGEQLQLTLHQQTTGSCRNVDHFFPLWTADDDTVAIVKGLPVRRFIALLQMFGERHDPSRSMFSPLAEFADGHAFTIDTSDVQRTFSCGDKCTAVALTNLKLEAKVHKPGT